MLQKRLKRFFKLIKKDLFSEDTVWISIIKIIGSIIVLSAVAIFITFILAGVGYAVTLLWSEPFINSQTNSSGSNAFSSYTDVGSGFCILVVIAGFLIYGIISILRWFLRKWKESGKEE